MRRVLAVMVVPALVLVAARAGAAERPAGTYRATVTARNLEATGVPAQEARFDAGSWTLTLTPGHWEMRQHGGALGNAIAVGDLQVEGSLAKLTLRRIDGVPHHEYAGPVRWRLSGSSLRFRRAGVAWIYELYVLVAQPWTRTA